MNIHESAEDYLEAILILKERQGLVRSIDIVREKNFSKPSVSIAMKRLRENGYIEMDAEGYLSLLPSGMEIASGFIHATGCSPSFCSILASVRKPPLRTPAKSSMTLAWNPLKKLLPMQNRQD